MRIDINLATRPFVNRVPHVLLLSALGVAAAGQTAWNLALYLGARTEVRAAESQIAEIDRTEALLQRRGDVLKARLAKEDMRALAVKVAAAEDVLAQRAVSWSLLLERLEEVLPWDAALRSIATNVGQQDVGVRLDFRARNQEYYLEFIDALERSPCFSDVYPSGDVRTQSGEYEVSLSLSHDPSCGTVAKVDKKRGKTPARRGRHRG